MSSAVESMKRCIRCGVEQPFEQFVNKGGIITQKWCRSCRAKQPPPPPASDRGWGEESAEEYFDAQTRRVPQWWDRIWLVVLAQAFLDLVGKDSASAELRADAWRFFFSDRPADRHRREAICQVSNMDVDYIQQVARRKLGPTWSTWLKLQQDMAHAFDKDGNVLTLMSDDAKAEPV